MGVAEAILRLAPQTAAAVGVVAINLQDPGLVTISRKKPSFPVTNLLHLYLKDYEREVPFTLSYADLKGSNDAVALMDKEGNHTFWDTLIYSPQYKSELDENLKRIYALLKTGGDMSFTEHLEIDRIDFCNFANSFPFRIRVVNQYNDNHDYFYVKNADASRIYGLELEHLVSPNNINFLVSGTTLVEEHIVGIPGDTFILHNMTRPGINKVRIAKEFVKFNERCFVRLLGDMRAYNYVMDVTSDFDEDQYRVRAIDFDQQCYEGDIRVYLPQFHKENKSVVELVTGLLSPETIRQYQKEERVLMARRLKTSWTRLDDLLSALERDHISTPEKIVELALGLAHYHKDDDFRSCTSMGDILRKNLQSCLHLAEFQNPQY